MKVLVTGGAGFLGSHLCKFLLDENHEVLCLDNFYTGHKGNIKDFMSHDNFELIRHDVTLPIFLEVDAIFNLACPASPLHYQKSPVQTIRTSVNGAINMLGLAKRTGAPIFQASTSEVYGDPRISPQSEDYWGHVNPVGIRSCYDEGKRCAETLFFDYHRQFGVNIKVARIFNTYGPKMAVDDGRVVSNFVVQALQGKDLTVYGKGEQTRSFCFVSDLIKGINKFMWADNSIIGPVNLGNPAEISMLELADLIIEITGSKKSRVTFKELPADDPQQRCPDIENARNQLGWTPEVTLREGLTETIEYFRKIL